MSTHVRVPPVYLIVSPAIQAMARFVARTLPMVRSSKTTATHVSSPVILDIMRMVMPVIRLLTIVRTSTKPDAPVILE